jgi:23S rRNA pseudouridine1911/1915/1917 synthase
MTLRRSFEPTHKHTAYLPQCELLWPLIRVCSPSMARASSYVTLRDLKSWLVDLPKKPRIVYEDEDVLVAYKPSGLHSVGVAKNQAPTLTTWFEKHHPEVMAVTGKSKLDGGVLHRLDGATAGLVLAARNQIAFDRLSAAAFVKKYLALCYFDPQIKRGPTVPVWPLGVDSSPSRWHQRLCNLPVGLEMEEGYKFDIVSGFASFGPRAARVKLVDVIEDRPSNLVAPGGDLSKYGYHSQCQIVQKLDPRTVAFQVTLNRGFRHQVRAHLNYIGCPVIADPLYPIPANAAQAPLPSSEELIDEIGLYATSIHFTQPTTRKEVSVTLPEFDIRL